MKTRRWLRMSTGNTRRGGWPLSRLSQPVRFCFDFSSVFLIWHGVWFCDCYPHVGGADFQDFYRQCDPGDLIFSVSSSFCFGICEQIWIFPNFRESLANCNDLRWFLWWRHKQRFFRWFADKRENLCLYGLPNGEWEVNEPGDEVPPKLPEPILGINVARDALEKKDWICQVAIHSDSWLIAIASFLGAKFRFDKYDR